ncbi:MAG: FAD-dependent oxidoreductase [marine bacterium B5-7]|nr:MAG: FAD-dependent oxidoreductase [marine bacterium B5-7]
MSEHHAAILIIGGGAVGCSIAYHLARLNVADVVVIEKSRLTHGATWHAAGLVGQLRGKKNLTRLMQYSADLYGRLEAETGQATGWQSVGSLRVASSKQRWQEIRRTATTARSFGFELELLGPGEAFDKFPLMTTDDVYGAAWIPDDGYIDPTSLTNAYAAGARQGGVRFIEDQRVLGFDIQGSRIRTVETTLGSFQVDTVVNAAGLWARDVAALAGVALPAGVVEHQYLVTVKSDLVTPGLPTFRDPDKLAYIKPEAGSLALGGWEANAPVFAATGMPEGFARELLPSNMDRFEQIVLNAAKRVPLLGEIGIRELINGPIPVSADGEPVMGPVPGLDNFFVACGFTAGIAASGGAGKTLAEWIVDGEPEYDVFSFDVRRFGPHHARRDVLSARAVESYGRYYTMHWPGEETQVARELKVSPLYGELAMHGAVYGNRFGWERPNWFSNAEGEGDEYAFNRAKTRGFAAIASEHHAVRNDVALIDQSSFAKLEVTGKGAAAALDRLATARVDRDPGAVIYTQMCNDDGGIECDLTIMRTDLERFYIVTGSGFGVHDFDWIQRHLPADAGLICREITTCIAVINLVGPRSRDVLIRVSDADVDNDSFKFARCQYINIGAAEVLAVRIGYVGELGYELHIPVESVLYVYRALRDAGADLGICDAGYAAIDSLRMEKGYRYWSADITSDDTPFEAGLDFCVNLGKSEFIGRDALVRQKEHGIKRTLCTFTIDAPPVFYGSECIYLNDQVVGSTSSANFGHTLGTNIAMGYLPIEIATEQSFEIEAFSERYPAKRCDNVLYDPDMSRLKS